MTQHLLIMDKISKKFPGVVANNDISIYLDKGEILALLGENGAGKSTLMNILYGLIKPTAGTIYLNGNKVSFNSPKDAIDSSIGMVHQHFMLIDNLTATENIILGNEPGNFSFIDYKKSREEVIELSKRFSLEINPDEKIEYLSVGLQQRVEILKALYKKVNILILDEPTAVLTPQEVNSLFTTLKLIIQTGISIIIITHKLDEVKNIAERMYILRNGKITGEKNPKNTSKEEMAYLMVGREVEITVEKKEHTPGKTKVFSIEDLVVKNEKHLIAVKAVNLDIYPGEIVGIAGVEGNGQTELAEAIIGLRKIESGKLFLNSVDITHFKIKQRIEQSFSYVPADRQNSGLIMEMKISDNLILGNHNKKQFSKYSVQLENEISKHAKFLVSQYDIRTSSVLSPLNNLSGGNQQKVILARELSANPKFLLICQPTRGLDVSAIEYIHNRILQMRDQNTAILMFSLELDEILTLSDRILVMYGGSIAKDFSHTKPSMNEISWYMTGADKKPCNE